ncbi:MAG: methylated-DNA--[protein]-cysteine S-methyltransferase [Treponema sp.]|jgi:methylated-DNA-[protein]-cysteine S-methyltransferase|nr:methylated-DNA--[protein]-cysteine S-methyltransferase [Treponema sp.]
MTTTIFTCSIDTPLGAMTASAEDGKLSGLWFKGQKYFPQTTSWQTNPDYPVFKTLRAWLTEYFAGKKMAAPGKDSPYRELFNFNPTGTDFQKRVWKALVKIPYGKLSSYGAIARQLGSQPRAVGGAVGHNPISILVPCHRVVGADGTLTGYAGGLDRKKALLGIEGSWGA